MSRSPVTDGQRVNPTVQDYPLVVVGAEGNLSHAFGVYDVLATLNGCLPHGLGNLA